jgi:hypothetical protein
MLTSRAVGSPVRPEGPLGDRVIVSTRFCD